MRIYTRAGDLAFEEFTFPDGQPHFKLLTWERDFRYATIEMALRTAADLFRARLAADVLLSAGYTPNLDIRWLLGARMDRRIDKWQPFTLDIVSTILGNSFRKIRVLDVHSEVSTIYLNAENILPFGPVKQVLSTLGDVLVVVPDKGARDRVTKLTAHLVEDSIQANKNRDPQTGRITSIGTEGSERVKNRRCLIIDDICDGGATFTLLATHLKNIGATEVHLFVTHLIMSKGHKVLVEGGIDRIFCTDSFRDWSSVPFIPVSCIPVSMKEM